MEVFEVHEGQPEGSSAGPFSSAQQAGPSISNSNAPVVIQDFFLESGL